VGKANIRNGARVSNSAGINELIALLEQTGSLETALIESVRLACEAAGAPAGAVVADIDVTQAAGYWFRCDPQGLLNPATDDRTVPEAPTRGQNSVVQPADDLLRKIHVPLSCAGRSVGGLILLTPRNQRGEHVQTRIIGITTVLAVLLAALENSVAGPLSGMLGREAFRARVISELSRSQRSDDEFSVLHVRVASGGESSRDEMTNPWTRAARLGETLAMRLRKSDLVGLLAPDHLAVLLAGTGRLGARIAARRIEQLARTPRTDRPNRSSFGPVSPECCLKSFPGDGDDVDGLCRVEHWGSEAAVAGRG
jgi:hypothetical protein